MKRALYLVIAALIMIPSHIQAKTTIECVGESDTKFTMSVPDNWVANTVKNGCQAVKKDKTSVVAVAYINHNGASAQALAKALSARLKIENPKFNGEGTTYCAVTGKLNGRETYISFTKGEDASDKTVQMVMRTGNDENAMDSILDSIDFK